MQLTDLAAAGSHPLEGNPEALRRAAATAGFALFEADLRHCQGKQDLLAALAAAARFPAGFGANWDALADALCDMSWQPADGYVLLLRHAPAMLGLAADDWEIAQDIFAAATEFWQQHGKPFWIFFA